MNGMKEIAARWAQILATEGSDALMAAIRNDVVSDAGESHTRTLLCLGNLWGKEALPLATAVQRTLDAPAAPVETETIRELRELLSVREAQYHALLERSQRATILKSRHEGLVKEKVSLAEQVAALAREVEGVKARLANVLASAEPPALAGRHQAIEGKLKLVAAEVARLREELT